MALLLILLAGILQGNLFVTEMFELLLLSLLEIPMMLIDRYTVRRRRVLLTDKKQEIIETIGIPDLLPSQ